MFPIVCTASTGGCGQTGVVASIPADLVCVACMTGDHLDLDERTAAAKTAFGPLEEAGAYTPDHSDGRDRQGETADFDRGYENGRRDQLNGDDPGVAQLGPEQSPYVKGYWAGYSSAIGEKGAARRTAAPDYARGVSNAWNANQMIENGASNPRRSSRIDTLRRIVQNKQHEKMEGVLVDTFTASHMIAVYDALSPENQAKFDSIPLEKLADLAFRVTSGLVDDPSLPMAKLPTGTPEQDADVDLLRDSDEPRKVIVPDGSAPYTQRALSRFQGKAVALTFSTPDGISTVAGRLASSGQIVRVGSTVTGLDTVLALRRLANQDGSADATGPTFGNAGEGGKCTVEGCDNAAQGEQKKCEQHTERDQSTSTARRRTASTECDDCSGTGAVPAGGGEDPEDVDNGYVKCPTCNGEGKTASKTAGRASCGSCGHTWASRSPLGPERCPQCSSSDLRTASNEGNSFTPRCNILMVDDSLCHLPLNHEGPHQSGSIKNTSSADRLHHAKVKVDQITQAVLASNPGMDPATARRVARQTVARYPKVAG